MRGSDRIDFPFEASTPGRVIEGCLFIYFNAGKLWSLRGERVDFSSNVQQISREIGTSKLSVSSESVQMSPTQVPKPYFYINSLLTLACNPLQLHT